MNFMFRKLNLMIKTRINPPSVIPILAVLQGKGLTKNKSWADGFPFPSLAQLTVGLR